MLGWQPQADLLSMVPFQVAVAGRVNLGCQAWPPGTQSVTGAAQGVSLSAGAHTVSLTRSRKAGLCSAGHDVRAVLEGSQTPAFDAGEAASRCTLLQLVTRAPHKVAQERVTRMQELYLRGLEDSLALQPLLGCQLVQGPLLQLASVSQ